MARPSTVESTTAFGAWLKREYENRGLTQTLLAERSGFRQSTIHGYVAGIRVPDQTKIEALVRALLGNDVDENVFRSLLNAGLSAAGFQKLDEPEYGPDLQMIVEAYSGGTETGRRAIKSAAELALEMNREGSIGKRAE